MLFRFSLTLILAVSLAACDRAAPDSAQEQGELTGEKAGLAPEVSGKIDRSQAGELMPAAKLTDPAGKKLNLAALQGTPVLVNLWATWCAPCIKEMPLLDELAGDYDGRLRVVTISQDMQGGEAVAPFYAERKFAHLQPWLDPDGAVMTELGATTLPTTILYDSGGQEVWRITGDYDWASAEARGAIDNSLDAG